MNVILLLQTVVLLIVFPVNPSPQPPARLPKATAEAKAIEVAVLAYSRDYGRFPLQTRADGDPTYDDDYARLITVLRGRERRNLVNDFRR